jgi:peptide/nickel transport system substrate-binding protein
VGHRGIARAVSAAMALVLVGAACTGGGLPVATPSATTGPVTSAPITPPPPVTPHPGGQAVFGAEQWPECVNPLTTCAAASWTYWSVLEHVLPRAMQLDAAGNLVASPLLDEAPTLANGGLTQNPFTVTYHISPMAVWEDGTQITASDLEFTWKAFLNTRGVYASVTGAYGSDPYEAILSINSTQFSTPVIVFKQPTADWANFFGGPYGFILKKAAFPDADPKRPNLAKEMLREIPFSGGPFRLVEWSPEKAVLVRNDRYFGPKALLDKVTFVPQNYIQADEIAALKNGQTSAIYPSMSWGGDPIPIDPKITVLGGDGIYFEALWFNQSLRPLDDPKVREALMYAFDRQAVVDRFIKPFNPNAEVLNCGFVAVPNIGPWCRAKPFEQFTWDAARARTILESDGYDCSATFCEKDGRLLEIQYSVYSSNLRRTDTQVLLVASARAAGISLRVKNWSGGLFVGPQLWALSDYATSADLPPSVTHSFACDEIPIPAANFYGGNFIAWCNPEVDRLLWKSDRAIDPDRRLRIFERIYALEAADFVSLPLYVLPAVSMWRSDQIAGPIGQYNSSPYGLFFNMNEWYVVTT